MEGNVNFTFKSPLDSHFSQTYPLIRCSDIRLRALWIHTSLKLNDQTVFKGTGLRALWIHTSLKPKSRKQWLPISLRALWIHTSLKLLKLLLLCIEGLRALWIHTSLKHIIDCLKIVEV